MKNINCFSKLQKINYASILKIQLLDFSKVKFQNIIPPPSPTMLITLFHSSYFKKTKF